jgi:hypothetical protein
VDQSSLLSATKWSDRLRGPDRQRRAVDRFADVVQDTTESSLYIITICPTTAAMSL